MKLSDSIKLTIYILFIWNSLCSIYTITQEFITNQFTNNDLTAWNPLGSSLPTVLFSSCSNKRVFGGYNVFTGDSTNPNSIQKTFTGLISHHSIRVRANFYKIDSWPNNNIFFMVDGVSGYVKNYNSVNGGTTNLCGNPNPINDAVNINYNDQILPIDFTVPHTSSTLTIKIISNLIGSSGSWGIRDLIITMQACDQSCSTCIYSNSCSLCGLGLSLTGAFCTCTTLGQRRQKIVPCLSMPCVTCVGSCSPGYYYSTTTTYCEPCNIACSDCSSPLNSQTTCTTCNPIGFVGGSPSVNGCLSCFLGCQQCSSTASNSCSACKLGYFLTNLNTCATSCPNKFYGQQSSRLCISCTTINCETCIGNYGGISYCSSCIANNYLFEYTCYLICPNNMLGYQGLCLSSCPQKTYADVGNKLCSNCSTNCLQCINSLTCFVCEQGAFFHNSACTLTCPPGRYPDTLNQLCQICHTDCTLCNGPFNNNCLSCSTLGHFLIRGSCYSSCPSFTYTPSCGQCSSTCLTCTGPALNNCLTCFAPLFLHLNTSRCQTLCSQGQISNNEDRTCLTCISSQVAYFQQCVQCNPTCYQCNGISFIQCVSCGYGTQLLMKTCILKQNRQIIYTPHIKSQSLYYSIIVIIILHFSLNILIQFIFKNKTNILFTIQILQILSYTKFLTLQLSQSVQKTLNFLYYLNFSALLTPRINDYNINIPIKFLISNKTGYYVIDSLGVHFIMLAVLLIYFITKYLSSKSKIFEYIYNKINPYIISYTFRLILLDFVLNIIVFIFCFTIQNAKGIGSLILLLFDIISLVFSLCWKINTEEDGVQITLLYNNEIGQKINDQLLQTEQKSHNLQHKIRKNKIMPSLITILLKIPIPITILIFSSNSSTQAICFIIYFSFYLLLTFIVPYKRKIYKYTVWFGNFILFLNALGAVLISRLQVNSFYLDVIYFTTILILNILSFSQLGINYIFLKNVILYHYYRLKRGQNTYFNNDDSLTNINKIQQIHNKSLQIIDGQLNFQKINMTKLNNTLIKQTGYKKRQILQRN